MGRAALGFAVAVFAYPLFVLLSGTPDAWGGALRVGGVTAIGVLGLGLPAFYVFRCKGWWQPWRFIAGGALGGLVCALFMTDPGAPNFLFFAVVFALGGAAHAVLFWFVAAWRNPALTQPREYCLGGVTYKAARSTLRGGDRSGR